MRAILFLMISEKRMERMKHVVAKRQSGLIVVLEDIYDPHNAAAVLRSCDAFGVQDVYFIFQHQKAFNPRKIGKVSSASANKWLDFTIFSTPKACIDALKNKGYTTYATLLDPSATSIHETRFHDESVALIFGNEHSGITPGLAALSDHHVYIPMRGFVQSFNLSVTASMILFEVTRQRMEMHSLKPLATDIQNMLLQEFITR